jgi:hypothetical protein
MLGLGWRTSNTNATVYAIADGAAELLRLAHGNER